MTSEHQHANPVSNGDQEAENVQLREQIDAARDAIPPIQAGLNQLRAALYRGRDYRARCRTAERINGLLAAGGEQLRTPLPGQVDVLGHELDGIVELLTAERGDTS